MHPQRRVISVDSPAPGAIGVPGMALGRIRQFITQVLFAAIFCIAGPALVMASPLQLPAVVEPASHEHHVGKVIFVELITPDLSAAKQFYTGLFGWTFRDIQSGGRQYAEAFHDGRPVAGLLQKQIPPGKHRQPAWLSFFAVRDADDAEKIALRHGAKVLFEPHSFPDRGREAVFADPQGAVFAVLASSSGDPPDVLAAPAEWIWSSLITTDPDADAAFYQTLFDYEVYDLPADDGTRHLLLASDNYARASANSLPANKPDLPPHWLNFVRVEDSVRMAAKVLELGGRVLVEPRVDRNGGKIAIVADPLGATFGLLEWGDADGKEVGK